MSAERPAPPRRLFPEREGEPLRPGETRDPDSWAAESVAAFDAEWAQHRPGPDPGSFGGHPYTPDEIALGYGTDHDPRFTKPATWYCKIGEVSRGLLPYGSDLPMREAITRAYREITGRDPVFLFSGWGAELTEAERRVVDND